MDLPQITFVLPHIVYWLGLLLFPLVYMVLYVIKKRKEERSLASAVSDQFIRKVDALSEFTGIFVGYWTLIAVFVYFYEVIARYVFNSPTNWAHESMFLMFGMQYVLAGAYAYKHDAHVRVDLAYAKCSVRYRAMLDIFTFFAFLIFCLGFMWSSWTFFSNSMNQENYFFATGFANEVSFTEWGVAYYPVKAALFIGGVLLLLQGISRLLKDIKTINEKPVEYREYQEYREPFEYKDTEQEAQETKSVLL